MNAQMINATNYELLIRERDEARAEIARLCGQQAPIQSAELDSIDTTEFLGRAIAASAEAMTSGPGEEWENFIAHIELWAARRALAAAPAQQVNIETAWVQGCPDKVYGSEWFIAKTKYGERVVLRALPEEFTYDYKTADETYMKAENIVAWMQFPDSNYIAFESAPAHALTDGDITSWAKWIVRERKEYHADHACAQCRPESEIVVPGFVCQYHQALAHLARKG